MNEENLIISDSHSDGEAMPTGIPHEDVVFIAIELGEQILRSGGEVSRVEDTIRRILTAYGATDIDVTAIMSLIVLNVDFGEETIVRARWITGGVTNLGRLSKLNNLSRRICRTLPDKAEFLGRLCDIDATTNISKWTHILGNILIAIGFAVVWGGSLLDAIISGLVAIPMCLGMKFFAGTKTNPIVAKVVVCFLSGVLAIVAGRILPSVNVSPVISGDIMLLLPGVMLANSFRDLLGGDLMSGIFRLCGALLDAVAIACGYAVAILILGGVAI